PCPGVVRGVILLAALLQVTRNPAVGFHMKGTSAVPPDDHQGGEIASGSEIKTSKDAGASGDIWLTRASAPCGLIHEPGLRGDTLIEDQIAEGILACGHALCLL